MLVFGVPVRGSLLSLLAICLLSALAFGALGLLLASRAQTVEGVSGLMNLVMLPMWIFSGVFFSSARFPDALQPFIQALPLTAVNDALRASHAGGGRAGVAAGAGARHHRGLAGGEFRCWRSACSAGAEVRMWQAGRGGGETCTAPLARSATRCTSLTTVCPTVMLKRMASANRRSR